MSAIAGLLRFDGGTVTRHGLERAANALRQYGPDRADIAVADGIGLVHVLMRMTPEDQFDRQPWQGASGALITADVRLDNRDEVLERIGIMPGEARAWPDSRVLLAGWEKLGDALWPMLRGPFAVAIWDSRRRALTLARDHLGLNVVMWHKSERFFAFATMPNGLFALDDVPRQLSEEKLADFLVLNHADHATTIYRNVFRLPPAHVMQIEADGSCRQFRYWSPAEIAPIELGSDQAYAEGLRERLDVAVRRQMRSAHPVGCLLSGGLDSSSVSALAARALAEKNERLAAFTGVPRRGFDGPVPAGHYADETPYVEAIARAVGNIDVTYVENDRCNDFAELERFFIALEGPVRNPTNFGWMLAILRLARTQGRRVLLGGFHGNCTISWNGWSQAVTHLKHGRLLTALRQWQMFYRHSPYSRRAALQKLFVEPLLPERLGNWADRRRHPGRLAAWHDHATIRPDFAAAMAVDDRAQKNGHDFLYRLRQDERVTCARPSRLCRRLACRGESRHRRRGARSDRRHRRGLVLLRRSATAVSCRRHRPLADPPRHVGTAAGQNFDQSHERPASGGLVRKARQPARRARAAGRRAFAVRAGAPGHRPRAAGACDQELAHAAAGTRPKSFRNIIWR